MQIPDSEKKKKKEHDHRLNQSNGAVSKPAPKLDEFGTYPHNSGRNDGHGPKKLFTSLMVAFLILLGGGCLKYCLKASKSLEEMPSKIAREHKKQENPPKSPKVPTLLSDNVLVDFPENVRKHFQYVVLIAKSELGGFWNNEPFDISKRKTLSSRKTLLPEKRLAISETKEGQLIVTPKLLGRIFDNLGESWYLDWDILRDTFRPLTIRLKNEFSQNSLQDILAQALKESGVQFSKNIQPKFFLNQEKLSSGVDEFLASISEAEKENIKYPSKGTPQAGTADSNESSKDWFKISLDLKQRIVFISGTSFHGCYIIFYLKDNHYGKLLLQKKIAWDADGQEIVVNQSELIKALSRFFELDVPTLVLNKEFTKLVDGAMAHRKGHGGKLNDKDRQKLIGLSTTNLMNSLK